MQIWVEMLVSSSFTQHCCRPALRAGWKSRGFSAPLRFFNSPLGLHHPLCEPAAVLEAALNLCECRGICSCSQPQDWGSACSLCSMEIIVSDFLLANLNGISVCVAAMCSLNHMRFVITQFRVRAWIGSRRVALGVRAGDVGSCFSPVFCRI